MGKEEEGEKNNFEMIFQLNLFLPRRHAAVIVEQSGRRFLILQLLFVLLLRKDNFLDTVEIGSAASASAAAAAGRRVMIVGRGHRSGRRWRSAATPRRGRTGRMGPSGRIDARYGHVRRVSLPESNQIEGGKLQSIVNLKKKLFQ